MNGNALEIKGITKNYETFKLKGIDLTLEKGTIMGLVGQNGAGKTTLINLIMNKIRRDGGSISVFGMDNIDREPDAKELIGYISDDEYMFCNYNLEKYRKVFSMAFKNWDNDLFNSLCKRFSLDTKKKTSQLSKGTKTKAMIALALAHKPKLLIMDEPTAGLDPAARIEVLDMLREFVADGESSVLFSTHITSDLDKIADYLTLIIDGEIIESMAIDEIEDKYAVVSGNGIPDSKAKKYLIGVRQGNSGYTALTRRADIPKIGDVAVQTPDIEKILTHNIWHRQGGAEK